MDHRDTYRDLLVYALAIAGNERTLAERLGVKVPQLLNWTMGIEEVPAAIFLRAIDVVVGATPEDIRRSREALTTIKPAANQSQPPGRDVTRDTSAHASPEDQARRLSGKANS